MITFFDQSNEAHQWPMPVLYTSPQSSFQYFDKSQQSLSPISLQYLSVRNPRSPQKLLNKNQQTETLTHLINMFQVCSFAEQQLHHSLVTSPCCLKEGSRAPLHINAHRGIKYGAHSSSQLEKSSLSSTIICVQFWCHSNLVPRSNASQIRPYSIVSS